ncbi:hypothetical protein DXT90_19765 [Agrobacterium tumefaciens]|nr:hypothetical protein [Agrobacterium tumefaciens]
MSRKSVQRFCDNDMRQNKGLKRRSESERSRHALGFRCLLITLFDEPANSSSRCVSCSETS